MHMLAWAFKALRSYLSVHRHREKESERERHMHTHVHKQLHCQNCNSPCKLFAPSLPYGHFMSALPDTHGVQQKTSDSLYHRSFHFTPIQNRHTWRNTNRCTQAYTQSTSDPKYLQNKQKNSKHFLFFSQRESTSRQPQTASRAGYMAAWKKSHSNGPNLLLQLQRSSHAHVHAFPRCMRAHKSEHSCQFNMVLKSLMARHWVTCRVTEMWGEKIMENDKSVLQFKTPLKTMYILKQYGATKQKRMVSGKGRRKRYGEWGGQRGSKITNH